MSSRTSPRAAGGSLNREILEWPRSGDADLFSGLRCRFTEAAAEHPAANRAETERHGAQAGRISTLRLTNSSEYRFRVGDYRIIYEFNIEQNEIYVLAVGNRDKIYKRRHLIQHSARPDRDAAADLAFFHIVTCSESPYFVQHGSGIHQDERRRE